MAEFRIRSEELHSLFNFLFNAISGIQVAKSYIFPNLEKFSPRLWRIDVISHCPWRVALGSAAGFHRELDRRGFFLRVSIVRVQWRFRHQAAAATRGDFRGVQAIRATLQPGARPDV